MKIYIVVPVFNDNKRACDTICKILEVSREKVIVINDGSTDNTGVLLKENFGNNRRVEILTHEVNYGKGAAMRTGIEKAWSEGAKAVIFIDSDGQHDTRLLSLFEREIVTNLLVFGYREINKEMPLLRRWFNIIVRHVIRFLFGIKKRDLFCGYFAIRKKIYKKIRWNENRYGVEAEIATRVGRGKVPFKEIRVDTIYLGKKHGISWPDGVKILLKIPWWFFEK